MDKELVLVSVFEMMHKKNPGLMPGFLFGMIPNILVPCILLSIVF